MVITDPNQMMISVQMALENTTAQLFTKLLDIIDKNVYGDSPDWYERTNEFRDSWQKTKASIMVNMAESEIYQEVSKIVWSGEGSPLFQHGNIYQGLSGDALADILNKGTKKASFGFSPVEATNFWDEFQTYVDQNLDRIFMQNCALYGLKVGKGFINATW